jgi:hypothetical protein
MLIQTLAEGVQRGEIDADVPPPLLLLSTFGLGAIPQLVRRAAGGKAPFKGLPPPRELAQASTDLLLRAIGTRRKPTRPRT